MLGNHDVVIYNFRLELVERLLKEGYEVYISSPYGERIEALKKLGAHYIDTKVSRRGLSIWEDYALLRNYRRMMKKINPDIVFTYTIKPNIYGAMACAKRRIPCVANITGLGTAVENGGFLQAVNLWMYKYAFRKIRRVFFQNEENMAFFAKHKIAVDRHALLPGSGVNLERFSPLPYPDENTVEFAFISRIMKEKGIDQYLDAAKAIREKYPHTCFHVCGFCEQAYEEELKELDKSGVILYHGMVRDIREILKTVHCTVHPTYYPEGLSNVLLESCACARPIITTNRSGCKEVIEDGVNGYVVKQKDSDDLIRKLQQFLALSQKDRIQMGQNGRKKVEIEFDRQIVVDRYLLEIGMDIG
ncbi:MAG: glycosyltransferase family 4 protein [Clostridiales bacterium]|nr:glycosyltransferase family 4 protein [Clostridiales bacterium]